MSILTGFDWWAKFKGTAMEGKRVQILYDYNAAPGVSNPKYVGIAMAGFADSDFKWFITRFDYDGNNQVIAQYESNNNVRWSNRLLEVYNAKDPT